jgi:uncharacterized protein (UPF0333 family)
MRKAQTILEYSVLIACLVASLVAIQIYLKRSFEGRIRANADSFAQQYSAGHTWSTDPFTVTRNASSTTVVDVQDLDDKTIVNSTTTIGSNGPDTESTSGSLTLDSLSNEPLY